MKAKINQHKEFGNTYQF